MIMTLADICMTLIALCLVALTVKWIVVGEAKENEKRSVPIPIHCNEESFYQKEQKEEQKRYFAMEIIKIGNMNVPNRIYVNAEKVIADYLNPVQQFDADDREGSPTSYPNEKD